MLAVSFLSSSNRGDNMPLPPNISHGGVAHKIDYLLVVHGNDDPALVTELMFVCLRFQVMLGTFDLFSQIKCGPWFLLL